jgi:hypothetical protein
MNRNDTFVPDVMAIPLNPRPSYDALITAGQPRAFGRIIALSDDNRTARVVWRGTPGTYAFVPDARTIDVAVIMTGKIIIRVAGQPERVAVAGTLIEFPREPFEMEIVEEFTKVSFLYNPDAPLKLQPEQP